MAKRKIPTPTHVAPESNSYKYVSTLLDDLTLILSRDLEKEYDDRIAEGERQLEIIAVQIEAQQKRELARRAECRRLRLEREAAEKARVGAKPKRKGKIPVQAGT